MEIVYSVPYNLEIVEMAIMLMLIAVFSNCCSVFLDLFQHFISKDWSSQSFVLTDKKMLFSFTNVDTIASVVRIFIKYFWINTLE